MLSAAKGSRFDMTQLRYFNSLLYFKQFQTLRAVSENANHRAPLLMLQANTPQQFQNPRRMVRDKRRNQHPTISLLRTGYIEPFNGDEWKRQVVEPFNIPGRGRAVDTLAA